MQYDVANHLIKRDDREYKLDPIINSLLQFLLANANRLVTRKEINDHVWPNICVSDDAINRAVSVLRKSLSEQRDKFLITVRGEGYRFINHELISIMQAEHLTSSQKERTQQSSSTQDGRVSSIKSKFWQTGLIGILSIVCISLIILIWQNTLFSGNESSNLNTANFQFDPISINVSPFSSIGKKTYSSKFDNNLLNEILMELSISPNIDVTESNHLSQEDPNHSFHLSGTIDFKPNGAKVIVKLSNRQTERFYPAIFFIKNNKDLNQEDIESIIAKNIAATVRLKVLHGAMAEHYASLLNRVTPLDIEQLYLARSELIKHEASAGNALKVIQELLKKHPDISEIKGAFAFAFNLSNINLWTYDELETNIKMTQQVLSEAPKNYDALISLFYSYALHPHYRFKAFEIAERLTKHYPDDLGAWYAQLYINTSSFLPCEKINRNIMQTKGAEVFPSAHLEVMNRILQACSSTSSHLQLEQQLLTYIEEIRRSNPQLGLQLQNTYYKLFAFFPLRVDTKLASDREHLRRAPRNSYRYNLFETLLMLNQDVTAKALLQQFEGKTSENWLLVSSLLAEIEGSEVSKSKHLHALSNDELINQRISVLLPITTAVLIKRAQTWLPAQREAYFSRLLDTVPTYSMSLDSVEHSIAIIAAQYYAGKHSQSRINAATLFRYLEKYDEQEPESYKFWGLAKYQFIAGFYCQNECSDVNSSRHNEVLTKFYADEVYWAHNRNMLAAYLAPFSDEPAVQQYLTQIETDANRAASVLMF